MFLMLIKKGIKKYFFAIIDQARANYLIDKETVEFLKVNFRKVPVFYALPKVHKSMDDPPQELAYSLRKSASI